MEVIDVNVDSRIVQNAFQRIFCKRNLVLVDPDADIPAEHGEQNRDPFMIFIQQCLA